MNASEDFKEDFLKLLFQNAAITDIGDASGILGSTTAGNLYLRLCTDAVEVDAETLGTECAYTGYAAGGVAVARNATKWPVTDNVAENGEEIAFGERTDSGATETVTYVEVWKDNSSSDITDRIAWVELDTPLAVNEGSVPRFSAGALTFEMN